MTRPATRSIVRWTICAIGLTGATCAAAAPARYATQEVGGWTVAASSDAKGCFLTRQYDRAGDTTLLFGLDGDGTNHLSVLNANWSIRPKERVELIFGLGTSRYPKQLAIGMASDGKQGFVTGFGAKFPDQLAAARRLEIFRGDVTVERLDLAGSGAAVTELRACVAAVAAKPAAGRDDEAGAESIPEDPFAPARTLKARKRTRD